MNKNFIISYAKNISKDHIIAFANKENISISDYEANIIHNAIQIDAEEIVNGDFYSYIKQYESELNSELYNKIIDLYDKYKSIIG